MGAYVAPFVLGIYVGLLLTTGVWGWRHARQSKKDFASWEDYWRYERLKIGRELAATITDETMRRELLAELDQAFITLEARRKKTRSEP